MHNTTSIYTGKKFILICQIKAILFLFAFHHSGWINKNSTFLYEVAGTALSSKESTLQAVLFSGKVDPKQRSPHKPSWKTHKHGAKLCTKL